MLDHRGTWAAIIAKETELSQWNIVENRVDFQSSDKTQRAFVSFRNFGITIKDQPTKNYFVDKATKLIRIVTNLHGFESPLAVERLGVRAKVCQPYDGDFSDVADLFRSIFFKPEPLDKLGGADNVVDVGALLHFKSKLGQINARIGATDLDQVKVLFQNHDNHPEASWTSDMDYFTKTPKIMEEKDVSRNVTAFVSELAERYAAIVDLINLAEA